MPIVKIHFDELARDYRYHDKDHQFKILTQIKQRLVRMTSVRNYFDFI